MIDSGLGFQFVPWSPSLEKQLGHYVTGIVKDAGGIEWEFRRVRDLRVSPNQARRTSWFSALMLAISARLSDQPLELAARVSADLLGLLKKLFG